MFALNLIERLMLVRVTLVCAAIIGLGFSRANADISLDFVGQWGGGVPCVSAVAVGDRVYAGMGPNLVALDVSDKAKPVQLGKLRLQNSVFAIAVSGNIAFVTTDYGKLHVVDISNPQNLTSIG